jgi:hypothetical protein
MTKYEAETAIKSFALYFREHLSDKVDAFPLPKWYCEARDVVGEVEASIMFYKEVEK